MVGEEACTACVLSRCDANLVSTASDNFSLVRKLAELGILVFKELVAKTRPQAPTSAAAA